MHKCACNTRDEEDSLRPHSGGYGPMRLEIRVEAEARSHGCTDMCTSDWSEGNCLEAHYRGYSSVCLEMRAKAEARSHGCTDVRASDWSE